MSFVCFLSVLFAKGTLKRKVVLTSVVAIGVSVNWLTEPLLIDISYRIFIRQHERELFEANKILQNKRGDIWITRDSITDRNEELSVTEKQKLLKVREKVGVYMILKKDSTIYYDLWGFLDVRLGLTYNLDKNLSSQYRHSKGNWYH